jgi:hypothetical protein
MRYDLRLAFKRLEQVKSEKRAGGNVVRGALFALPPYPRLCRHQVSRHCDIELWLAPLRARVMVPYRVVGAPPIGVGFAQAT